MESPADKYLNGKNITDWILLAYLRREFVYILFDHGLQMSLYAISTQLLAFVNLSSYSITFGLDVLWLPFLTLSLRKKSPYSEFFWFVFSRIRTEYGEIRSISECGKIRTIKTQNTDSLHAVCYWFANFIVVV